jgi:hypothetical protein
MTTSTQPTPPRPATASALLRHFADLRDGTHGGAGSRQDIPATTNQQRLNG